MLLDSIERRWLGDPDEPGMDRDLALRLLCSTRQATGGQALPECPGCRRCGEPVQLRLQL